MIGSGRSRGFRVLFHELTPVPDPDRRARRQDAPQSPARAREPRRREQAEHLERVEGRPAHPGLPEDGESLRRETDERGALDDPVARVAAERVARSIRADDPLQEQRRSGRLPAAASASFLQRWQVCPQTRYRVVQVALGGAPESPLGEPAEELQVLDHALSRGAEHDRARRPGRRKKRSRRDRPQSTPREALAKDALRRARAPKGRRDEKDLLSLRCDASHSWSVSPQPGFVPARRGKR